MKLLLFTQKVDSTDQYLNHFQRWIIELSKQFESIIVICLEEGKHDFPENVRVLSLGKEERQSRLQYLIHFYWHILTQRKNYEVVLSHKNQEYIVLGGIIWRILRKKIVMYRDNRAGNVLTSIAGALCNRIFYASDHSYVASSRKGVKMPIGIDAEVEASMKNQNYQLVLPVWIKEQLAKL